MSEMIIKPSYIHILLIFIFGPIGGIILRYHHNKNDRRELGSFLWYISLIGLLAGGVAYGAVLGPVLGFSLLNPW